MDADRTPMPRRAERRVDATRRRALLALALSGLAAVAGCSSTPPVPATAAPTRRERIAAALRAMNFSPEGDDWYLSLPVPLLFEFGRDVVGEGARQSLGGVARQLTELDVARVLVRGHTDNIGSHEFNLALSKRRADAVARVLTDSGFPAARMDSRGLGYAVPVADNGTEEGRAQNRRVVIIVQID